MDLRRTWPTIGLAVLLVLDLVLVVWALRPSSQGSAALATESTVASTADPTTSGTPIPAATKAPTPDPTALPRPLTRLVVPVGKNAVWTADVGTCKQPGELHVSDDRAKSWTTQQAEGSVTRIRPDGATTAFVIGGTGQCETRLWTTTDAGATWNGPQSAAASWGRSPKDARLVHRPGGDPVTPCGGRAVVLDLVALDASNATALCGDGRLRRTSNAGKEWRTSVTHEGAVALALSSADTGVVASVDADCTGVVVGVLADAKVGRERCVDDVKVSPGEVALGVAPSGVWLAAGDAVLRAGEPGAAFERASAWPTD